MTERGAGDVRDAYAKYKGVYAALDDMRRMKVEGTWTLGKVTLEDIISIFMCKTNWYTHYRPPFSKVTKFPSLLKWLDRDASAKDDGEIWAHPKPTYSLQDLNQLLEWYESRIAKKEKRKRQSEKAMAGPSKKQKRAKSYEDL
jgi:hypothetical protein